MSRNWKLVLANTKATLMRRGRTMHDAEDLVQEAWLRYARYQRDNTVEKPEAFLMRTALNLSVDAHRARLLRGEEVNVDDLELEDPSPGAEATVLGRERVARADACLRRLGAETQAIFLAHRVEGLSFQQIATLRQIPVTRVEYHVAKATTALALALQGW